MIQVLTNICVDWGRRCFGVDHMADKNIRALRFLEEATELAQACGVSKAKALAVVDTVYIRPEGKPFQEIGGSMVTLSVLCHTLGIDLEDAFEIEVLRCLSKSPESFAKRNQEKLDLGLK